MKTVALFENYKNHANGNRTVTGYTLSHVWSDCGRATWCADDAVDYILPAGFDADKLTGVIYGPAGSYYAVHHSSGRPP